ncbi:SseB family protein [Aeromicrobium duanguangcaii]|uniref:SseB family protein n=1 Tax=Aeromicrobium duanguangcaii TaxID=2968086 RepID=A0ABY5KKC1_9ACTN|nr:SseB family protein [Aeromicrobium duanguangcaii]MCD9152984.1 SseB family protein [Aeromicrobium duanguangcaii]UUI69911.1 SseB family protein [Aeromicrobium duanguangcaii]
MSVHGGGRSLASPAFPDDDGSTDPTLDLTDDTTVLATLGTARVFVPVVAVLGEQATDGSDKNSDMAAVLMTGADGRTALLAFSSIETMTRWNPNSRPVPVYGRDAARSAIAEGASALLLDLAQPSFSVVETEDLEHLAAEHVLVRTPAGTAWVEPA